MILLNNFLSLWPVGKDIDEADELASDVGFDILVRNCSCSFGIINFGLPCILVNKVLAA